MTAKPITAFEVDHEDDCIQIRKLGQLVFDGAVMNVEIESFSDSEDGTTAQDYDALSADIHLKRADHSDILEFANNTDTRGRLEKALQDFMTATVEGDSEVGWGESGAQSDEQLSFGRNGW